jgi:hypothetical protein
VLFTVCFSGDKIKKNKMGWECSPYGERIVLYRILSGKPEGKRPPERPGLDGRIIL